MAIKRYPYGIPSSTCFIKVIGEDGVFYDLVNSKNVKTHIADLIEGGYVTKVVSPKVVPDCIFRDFTDNGLKSYKEVIFRKGGGFYHEE